MSLFKLSENEFNKMISTECIEIPRKRRLLPPADIYPVCKKSLSAPDCKRTYFTVRKRSGEVVQAPRSKRAKRWACADSPMKRMLCAALDSAERSRFLDVKKMKTSST